MADKTFGVKVSEDLYDKVQDMIDFSTLSAKDWFEKAVILVETNSIKEGSVEFSQDLSELETHTTRIYELVANMVQRSIYLKESALKELADKVEQKDLIIGDYQLKVKEAIGESVLANSSTELLQKERDLIMQQLEEVRTSHENNQALISEYKEKIDTLSGLISKYQSFADENENLKERFLKESEILKSQTREVNLINDGQKAEIDELKRTVDTLTERHQIELERTIEKKEYENDRALLEMERQLQEKLITTNREHNSEIKKLYDELAAVRKEHEERIEKMKNQIENISTSTDKLEGNE